MGLMFNEPLAAYWNYISRGGSDEALRRSCRVSTSDDCGLGRSSLTVRTSVAEERCRCATGAAVCAPPPDCTIVCVPLHSLWPAALLCGAPLPMNRIATTRCALRLFKVSRGDWDGTDGLFADGAPERVAAESSEVGRLLW